MALLKGGGDYCIIHLLSWSIHEVASYEVPRELSSCPSTEVYNHALLILNALSSYFILLYTAKCQNICFRSFKRISYLSIMIYSAIVHSLYVCLPSTFINKLKWRCPLSMLYKGSNKRESNADHSPPLITSVPVSGHGWENPTDLSTSLCPTTAHRSSMQRQRMTSRDHDYWAVIQTKWTPRLYLISRSVDVAIDLMLGQIVK